MKNAATAAVVIALVSLILGVISRVVLKPFIFGLEANAFLRFADTSLLFAIALSLLKPKS